MPLRYEFVRDYAADGYQLAGWCPTCLCGVEASFARLVMRGKGDKRLRDVRIRHRCGATLELRILPPEEGQGPAIRMDQLMKGVSG